MTKTKNILALTLRDMHSNFDMGFCLKQKEKITHDVFYLFSKALVHPYLRFEQCLSAIHSKNRIDSIYYTIDNYIELKDKISVYYEGAFVAILKLWCQKKRVYYKEIPCYYTDPVKDYFNKKYPDISLTLAEKIKIEGGYDAKHPKEIEAIACLLYVMSVYPVNR